MLVAEYFEAAPGDGAGLPDPDLSVGKVEVAELSVDALSVGGTIRAAITT
jgi:hypothetical protein